MNDFPNSPEEVDFYNALRIAHDLPDMVAKALARTAANAIQERKERLAKTEREIVQVLQANGLDHISAVTVAAVTLAHLRENGESASPSTATETH